MSDRLPNNNQQLQEYSFERQSPEYQTTSHETQTNFNNPSQNQTNSFDPNSNTTINAVQSNQSNTASNLFQSSSRRETPYDVSFDLVGDMSTFDDESNNVEPGETFATDAATEESPSIPADHIKNDMYLERIKRLSLKVHQQASIIKDRDAEIRRLRATTISN